MTTKFYGEAKGEGICGWLNNSVCSVHIYGKVCFMFGFRSDAFLNRKGEFHFSYYVKKNGRSFV